MGVEIEGRGNPVRSGLSSKCLVSGQALEEYATKGPNIRPRIDRAAPILLGTGIAGGSEGRAITCVFGLSFDPPRPGEAEVEYLDDSFGGDSIFCGFRSQWTIPCRWAASRAVAI